MQFFHPSEKSKSGHVVKMPHSAEFVTLGCGWVIHVSFEDGKHCSSLKASHSYLTPRDLGSPSGPMLCTLSLGALGSSLGHSWGAPEPLWLPEGRGSMCCESQPLREPSVLPGLASPFLHACPSGLSLAPVVPVHLSCRLKCGPMAHPIAPYVALPTLNPVPPNWWGTLSQLWSRQPASCCFLGRIPHVFS